MGSGSSKTAQKEPEIKGDQLKQAQRIQVGDELPSVKLFRAGLTDQIDIKEYCQKKKIIIFGLPGAFTPVCSKSHLPGYIANHDKLIAQGIDEIICVSVNDVYVMNAWEDVTGAFGKVLLLADTNADFVKATGLAMDLPMLGGVRSQRFSMVLENGKVLGVLVEEDSTNAVCSTAAHILEEFKKNKLLKWQSKAMSVNSMGHQEGSVEAKAAEGKPTQEEPAQEEPAQEEPAQEEPAQEEPAQEEPAQEEPAQEEPAQEEPAQEEPAQEEPAQEEPAQEEPGQEEPAQKEPAQEEPTEVSQS
eukprot:Nk52_evm31s222 gene=Nk52_evmTU31s222